MEFFFENEIDNCQTLWESFSPRKTLFDDWEYRTCFYEGYKNQPHFIVGKENGIPTGILPLWYEKKGKYYTFFGGLFPENNTFFLRDKSQINSYLSECPVETWLCYIHASEKEHYPFAETETKYYLDMSLYDCDIERYLSCFDKKHRKNLRYDLKQLAKLNYSFRYNQISDFEKLIELNKKRFGGESDYSEDEMIQSMHHMMNTALSKGELNLVSLIIDDKPEAVEFAISYDGTYTILSGGRNIEIENIGKPMVLEHIRNALAQGISKIDFLSSDTGWKKSWHLKEEPVYEYKNYVK
ncbi:MAG: GNAT family N-acetyltransferase [Candidatus Altiarchaeota archaeon]